MTRGRITREESNDSRLDGQLLAWYTVAKKANWSSPQDARDQWPKASVLKSNRICFDIKGGSYRLIVEFDYPRNFGRIVFFGTHAAYDAIDANTVEQIS